MQRWLGFSTVYAPDRDATKAQAEDEIEQPQARYHDDHHANELRDCGIHRELPHRPEQEPDNGQHNNYGDERHA